MDKALTGFLIVFGIFHLLLIVVPMSTTLRAAISAYSKIYWSAFLIFLPFIGVAVFHFRFRSSLFVGKPYEPSPHDLGVKPGRYSPDDRE